MENKICKCFDSNAEKNFPVVLLIGWHGSSMAWVNTLTPLFDIINGFVTLLRYTWLFPKEKLTNFDEYFRTIIGRKC